MNSNTKEQGGDRWIIGGTIEMSDGTHLVLGGTTLEVLLQSKLSALNAEAQTDSTATTIAELKSDFNALLTKLKAASIMAED